MIVSTYQAGSIIDELLQVPWTPIKNCWRQTGVLQRRLYGRSLPVFRFTGVDNARRLFASSHERNRWVEITDPRDGAIVLMERFCGAEHCGTYLNIDGGLVFHTEPDWPSMDSVFDLVHLRKWKVSFFVPCPK